MSDMSNSDARKRAGQVTTFTDPYAGTRKPDEQTTPRIARSIDDLRVGQVVAWCDQDGYWTAARSPINNSSLADWSQMDIQRGVVILADPPAPTAADWLVPGEAMEALREATDRFENPDYVGNRWVHYVDAVTAVLDAAREVGHE